MLQINAAESYNRLHKGGSPYHLEVAVMTTYKLDMAAAIQHLAVLSGTTVAYERQTPEARSVCSRNPVHKVKPGLKEVVCQS